MLGALGGSGVLPFRKAAFEAAIKKGGIAVKTNLAAFEDAYQRAAAGGDAGRATQAEAAATGELRAVPAQARSPKLQPLLDRVRRFAAPVQQTAFEGVRRAIDYQDPAYAALYLERVEKIAALDAKQGGGSDGQWALTEATARALALWMTFEDTIRVADLKTRPARFVRVREEIRADTAQLFGITEFMKPRVVEMAGTLPAGMGRWILRSPGICRFLTRWTGGRHVRTSTVTGFLMLYLLGGMKRWRRGTLRYHEENERMEQWLGRIERLAATNYALAVELAKAQRLVKGYGETHERGWRNFSTLVDKLDELAVRPDGAAVFARLMTAALADEEGKALARELAEISSAAVVKVALERARA
jgi:indolepyruvate ferredoxin oxidoreductase beta subunit